MLDNIFTTVINMGITASIAAVVIMGVRLILRQKLPKLFSYALWAIVLVRLLVPYSFSSPLSLFNIMPVITSPEITQRPDDIRNSPQFDASSPSVAEGNSFNDNRQDSLSNSTTLQFSDIARPAMPALSVIWIIGFILLFGFCIITYLRTISKLRTATKYHDITLLSGFMLKLGLKREIEIYTSDMIHSPVVCGVIKPRLILPVSIIESSDETILQHIVVHELVHIKRRDYITNAISIFALCIHWFNPIIWISFLLSRKDMEMSCDEKVLSILGTDMRNSYAGSLLNLAVKQNNLLNGGVLAFGESSIKGRIKSIMRYKKPAFWAVSVSAVILVLLCVVMISNPYINASNDIAIDRSSLVEDKPIENWIDYKDMPEYLINSVIAAEDERFRNHNGIDWISTSSAFIQMINPLDKSLSGGSTITQQLVKNITGDNVHAMQRKKREMERAIALEKNYTKEQIMEAYLNIVYLGHHTVGVKDAANYYFGKDIKELSLSESASVAAIIAAPSHYNPLDNPENNRLKRDAIINKMFDLKMITEEERQQALSES